MDTIFCNTPQNFKNLLGWIFFQERFGNVYNNIKITINSSMTKVRIIETSPSIYQINQLVSIW